jgi:hypothetical protein
LQRLVGCIQPLIRRVGFCLYALNDSGCRGFIAARPEARPKHLSFSRERSHQGQHRDCKQYPSQNVTSIPMVLIVSNRRDLSRRPVQSRTDPLRRLVIPDLIHAIDDLDPLHRAPAGHEGARKRCIREADREGIIHHASCARWDQGPPISPTIGVQPCVHLIEPVAESFGRNADPDPDRKPVFGVPNRLLRGSHEAARR